MAERPRPPVDWGDPDPEEILAQREPTTPPGRRLRDSARALLLLGLVAAVVAAIGGYVLARSAPEVAAGLLVRDVVRTEPIGTATDGPAPSSGTDEFGITDTCGVLDVVSVDDQRRAMYSGVVVVQVRDRDLLGDATAWYEEQDAPVIVAVNPALDTPVVATAWARRMPLTGVNEEFLTAFVVAHGRMAPADAAC